MRVAVVGSGPAGGYAANALLQHRNVEVDVYDRSHAPHGLIRYGVAPDHQETKRIADVFPFARARLHLGVEVGKHSSHDELLEFHHAVIYATGAEVDNRLNIPGEGLPGSHSAREFVAWYNGDPEHAGREFDLSTERAVIIGNGNVALDVARILTTDPEQLASTDIADPALAALRASRIREVVVLGRRGVDHAAYSTAEFLALVDRADIDVVVDADELASPGRAGQPDAAGQDSPLARLRLDIVREAAARKPTGADRRIIFRYLASPVEILGDGRVTGVRIVRNEVSVDGDGVARARPAGVYGTIDAGLVLGSVGYRGSAIAGLPFDDGTGVMPNVAGRIVDPRTHDEIPGAYAAGWIKRGARGVIGSNKVCANETVESLLADYLTGRLETPSPPSPTFCVRPAKG